MSLKLGILIIGSLFWDDNYDRPRWRQDYLQIDEAIAVSAPVRYGRFSTNRQSYTMVFSSSAQNGQAKVVPTAHQLQKPKDLVDEAERLWKAEDNKINQVTSAWGGCVVLCVNNERNSQERAAFLEAWYQRVNHEPAVYRQFPQSPDDDKLLVNSEGLLDFWPTCLDGSKLDFDLLLATANYPFRAGNPCGYPDPRTIAQAWIGNLDELRYFRNNISNGFRTFQDAEIMQALPTEYQFS